MAVALTVALGMYQPAQTLTLKQIHRLLWVSVTGAALNSGRS